MDREDLKRRGAGRSLMKNNYSNWHLHYSLEKTKKYKNEFGIELNLNDNDTTSILIKQIVREAIKMVENSEKIELKCFLMKNFDIKIGEIK